MLRYTYNETKKVKIRNEYIKGAKGVAQIKDMVMENQLKWYGHVQ